MEFASISIVLPSTESIFNSFCLPGKILLSSAVIITEISYEYFFNPNPNPESVSTLLTRVSPSKKASFNSNFRTSSPQKCTPQLIYNGNLDHKKFNVSSWLNQKKGFFGPGDIPPTRSNIPNVALIIHPVTSNKVRTLEHKMF